MSQVQPSTKSFPTQTRCFPESDSEYYSSLVRMFQARRLLECLLILLTAPSAAVELRVFSAVRELLLYFMSSLNGLLFLSGSPGVMNILTRALIQTVDTEMPLSAMQPLSVSAWWRGGGDLHRALYYQPCNVCLQCKVFSDVASQ